MTARLEALAGEIEAALAPVKGVPFIVFHDAFQYFHHRYGLNTVGSLTVNPENQPGDQRLRENQAKIATPGARRVFTEPQRPEGRRVRKEYVRKSRCGRAPVH